MMKMNKQQNRAQIAWASNQERQRNGGVNGPAYNPNAERNRKRRQRKLQQKRQQQSSSNPMGASVPNAFSIGMVTTGPRTLSSRGGNLFGIRHRELIANVQPDSTGFSLLKNGTTNRFFRLNPASFGTFPWLSQIAVAFEKYKFRYLRFTYYARVSTNTSASILLSPEYDAADTGNHTEKGLASNQDTVEDAVYKTIVLRCDPKKMNGSYKEHYNVTDTRYAQTSQDLKTIDVGKLYVGVDGVANTNYGKLWVEYEVDLINPQEITENPNVGGQVQDFGTSADPANILNSVAQVQTEPTGPILDLSTATNGAFPRKAIGTFLRDYTGIFSSNFTGTGITTGPSVTLDGVALGNVGGIDLINGAGDSHVADWQVIARAGQQLAYDVNAVFTSTSGIQSFLSATSVF